jgi:hypothetical protein
MNDQNFKPKALSLEDIVRQQELAKYGQAVTVFTDKAAKKKKFGPTLIAA